MNEILELCKQYEQIILYRHINPDFDAYGSQLGFYWVLKTLFPHTNIIVEGQQNEMSGFFDYDHESSYQDVRSLGIVFDTANFERIDGDTKRCDKLIKIDHHIIVDSYGDLNIENEKASSCSEIVTLLFQSLNIEIPVNAANALYLGIVGDSNRFLYSSTSTSTFKAASYLLDSGINIDKLYQKIYLRKRKDLEMTKYIYNHYQYDEGIAWYYLSDETLKQLDISRQSGSSYVNALANIEEFKVWMAITENIEDSTYRVSIRSREVAINGVAAMFNGGGHHLASGCTLKSLDDLPLLINKIKGEF